MDSWSQSYLGNAARRHAGLIADLRRAVFESPGKTDPETRTRAASGAPLPEPLGSYSAKVRNQSWRVTEADIEALKGLGLSEDAIFEITVAAALGAALRCLAAGMSALGEES